MFSSAGTKQPWRAFSITEIKHPDQVTWAGVRFYCMFYLGLFGPCAKGQPSDYGRFSTKNQPFRGYSAAGVVRT